MAIKYRIDYFPGCCLVLHSIILKEGQLCNAENNSESQRGRVQSAPNGCLITAQYLGQRCCWLCGPAGAHQEVEGAPTPQEEYGALGLAPPGRSLEKRPLLSREARWRNCERLHPRRPLGFVPRRAAQHKHKHSLFFPFFFLASMFGCSSHPPLRRRLRHGRGRVDERSLSVLFVRGRKEVTESGTKRQKCHQNQFGCVHCCCRGCCLQVAAAAASARRSDRWTACTSSPWRASSPWWRRTETWSSCQRTSTSSWGSHRYDSTPANRRPDSIPLPVSLTGGCKHRVNSTVFRFFKRFWDLLPCDAALLESKRSF